MENSWFRAGKDDSANVLQVYLADDYDALHSAINHARLLYYGIILVSLFLLLYACASILPVYVDLSQSDAPKVSFRGDRVSAGVLLVIGGAVAIFIANALIVSRIASGFIRSIRREADSKAEIFAKATQEYAGDDSGLFARYSTLYRKI